MLVQDQVKEESMAIQEAAQRPQLPSDPNGWGRSGHCGDQQLFIFMCIHSPGKKWRDFATCKNNMINKS